MHFLYVLFATLEAFIDFFNNFEESEAAGTESYKLDLKIPY